jgi:chromate transporter
MLLRTEPRSDHAALALNVSRVTGAVMLAIFFVLLIALPLIAPVTALQGVKLLDAFYRAGSLVFGGGHVVLPLLQASVVATI